MAVTTKPSQIEIGMNATFDQSPVRVINAHDLYAVDWRTLTTTVSLYRALNEIRAVGIYCIVIINEPRRIYF